MTTFSGVDRDQIDQFLEHHGIKGMKWGKHQAGGGASGTPSHGQISTGKLTPGSGATEKIRKQDAKARKNQIGKPIKNKNGPGYHLAKNRKTVNIGQWYKNHPGIHNPEAVKKRGQAKATLKKSILPVVQKRAQTPKTVSTTPPAHTSVDAHVARQLQSTVKTHGTSALTNDQLNTLVTRLGLEQRHNQLNPPQVSAGRSIVNDLLGVGGSVAKTQARDFGNQYAKKGLEELIKKGFGAPK